MIKCKQFTITVTGERVVTIELLHDSLTWDVVYDGGDAGNVHQSFEELEEAVVHARKLAGDKVV
tara:strand:+ start:309 stop:500 length:192 start_codon:yes stop_codon:yes gene_type:complete